MKYPAAEVDIGVISELYTAGETEDGQDYVAERYRVVVRVKADGRTFMLSHYWKGCEVSEDGEGGTYFADVRERAAACAEIDAEGFRALAVFDTEMHGSPANPDAEWYETEPEYGSKHWQALEVDLTAKEKAEYAPAKTNDAVVKIDFGDVDKNALGMGYTAKRLLEVLARTQITGTPEDVKEIAQCVKTLTIDEAHFVFTRDDVASVVDTDRDEGRISDEEHSNWKPEYAQEVLRRVYQRHDVTMGVSFETLSEVVREVIAEKVTNVPNDGVPTP